MFSMFVVWGRLEWIWGVGLSPSFSSPKQFGLTSLGDTEGALGCVLLYEAGQGYAGGMSRGCWSRSLPRGRTLGGEAAVAPWVCVGCLWVLKNPNVSY